MNSPSDTGSPNPQPNPPERPVAPAHDLVVVSGADEACALLLGVLVQSIRGRLQPPQKLHLFVVDGGVGWPSRKRLEQIVRRPQAGTVFLNWMRLPPGQASHDADVRLVLPDVLPNWVTRVIYLDPGLIVEEDLAALWHVDLQGAIVAAVRDYRIDTVAHPLGLPRADAWGYAPEHPYFDPGVMVVDLERWREAGISLALADALAAGKEGEVQTVQQGLNAVLGHAWTPLEPRWNRPTWFLEATAGRASSAYQRTLWASSEALVQRPGIVHFAGHDPWSRPVPRPDYERFVRHLRASRWFWPGWERVWRWRHRRLEGRSRQHENPW